MANGKNKTVLDVNVLDDGNTLMADPTSYVPTFTFSPRDPSIDDIVFNNGNQEIARIEHKDYKPTRITLNEEVCANTTIQSQQAIDVKAEKIPGGYKIIKKMRRWIPQDVDVEEEFCQGPQNTITEFHQWVVNLDNDDLEAAIQVYYDRWNFENGDTMDHMRYLMLVEEREFRGRVRK